MRFSNFLLDTNRFLLERDGRRVALRPKVLDLLTLLVENRERVVPREELVESLWDGACVGPGSLSGLVNELRRALGERGKRNFIDPYGARTRLSVCDRDDRRSRRLDFLPTDLTNFTIRPK